MHSAGRKTGRLAPSPSGELHLGNALSFAAAWLSIRAVDGTLLLRVEDIDAQRCRSEIADQQRQDLEWLGLTWDSETPPQSQRSYHHHLEMLAPWTYLCHCTRRQLKGKNGPHKGPCARHDQEGPTATRLILPNTTERFVDRASGAHDIPLHAIEDPILWRKSEHPSYTLSVIVDDIRDGVTEVVRGADLLEQAAVQQVIWKMFTATPPTWLHAPILMGLDGTKLSKSQAATGIRHLREAGVTCSQIWRTLLPLLGISDCGTLQEAVPHFQPKHIDQSNIAASALKPLEETHS